MQNSAAKTDKNTSRSKTDLLFLAICALVPCFTFFIYAPFELYFANINEFWFGLSSFWFVSVGFALLSFLILFSIGLIFRKFGKVYVYGALLAGGGLACFIQGDYINLKLGVLNGEEIIWSDYYGRFVINALIWIAIIASAVILSVIFKNKSKKPIGVICAVILIIQAVTLTTLAVGGDKKNTSYGKVVTVKNLFTLSDKNNVVVFLMDMFDSDYMNEIIEDTPSVKDDFDNFIYYRNHTGSYSTTLYSIGSLLAGQHIDNSYPSFKDAVNAQSKSEKCMFPELMSKDCSIDMYFPFAEMAPDDVLNANTALSDPEDSYYINNYFRFSIKLYKLSASKFAPDFMKPYVWVDSSAFDRFRSSKGENAAYSEDNIALHELFDQGTVDKDDKEHFKFIYATGAHFPYTNDENFNRLPGDDYSRERAIGSARSSLKLCLQYIEKMKQSGVYDNTTIIIMADHGFYTEGALTNPLFMVKPSGSSEPFTISDAPTSSINFQATVMSAFGYNDDGRYGVSNTDISEGDRPERYFYQYSLAEPNVNNKFRLIEYKIAPEGNQRKMFSLTDREIETDGTVVVHHENCAYCEEHGMETPDVPNYEGVLHEQKK